MYQFNVVMYDCNNIKCGIIAFMYGNYDVMYGYINEMYEYNIVMYNSND